MHFDLTFFVRRESFAPIKKSSYLNRNYLSFGEINRIRRRFFSIDRIAYDAINSINRLTAFSNFEIERNERDVTQG